ncbi:MAG: hypothetical protein JWO69_748, partial [Thermoleophilia bacterium]|nr:hypothetical protein [Thermoleophilia bacterium]
PELAQAADAGLAPARRLTLPARAERSGLLPPAGSSAVGGVSLPPGRQVGRVLSEGVGVAALDLAGAVMWSTATPLEAPLTLFSPLAAAFPDTGLWPLLTRLDAADSDANWVDGHTGIQPATHASIDIDALLAADGAALLQPTGRAARLFDALRTRAVPARIALVPCTEPTQVPTRLAWQPAGAPHPATTAAALESWERRYGALLVGITPSALLLLVARPPADLDEARRTLAEHRALGVRPQPGADASTDLPADPDAEAAALVGAGLWQLGW